MRVRLDAARSPPTATMGRDLAHADMRAVTGDILADPRTASRLLDKALTDDLARTTELMASGRRVEALGELDRMHRVYGPLPDITLRRAMLRLREPDVTMAVAELRTRVHMPLRDRQGLLDEIAPRLDDGGLLPGSRANFDRLQKLALWMDDTAARRDLGALLPLQHEGRFELAYKMTKLAETRPATSAELASPAKGAAFYSPDAAGLDNID